MRPARLFVSQSVLDRWLSDGTADLSGDTLTILPDERRFELKTAVLFEKELTESGDPHELLGKVKDLEQIAELGGDYSAGSVILGDYAYEVIEGFVGEAQTGDALPALASIAPPARPRSGSGLAAADTTAVGMSSPDATAEGAAADLASALGAASGAGKGDNELDLLARFFLERR
ncbi:MAG: hypothetical protein OHK0013_31550 [Sandaracinaceae bacterium]